MFKMTDGTVRLYADGNRTVKMENSTTGKGEETVCAIQKAKGFEVQCIHKRVDHCERKGRWTVSSKDKKVCL